MALVNHAKREINAKIIYYGPEGAGKATSVRYVYGRIKPSLRGELKTLPSSGSNLLFFDFSPFEQPLFAGYRLRLHIYTLQGRVANPAAWKLTLKGADGLILVADAAGDRSALQECTARLRGFLSGYGLSLGELPVVLQINKADLQDGLVPADLADALGITANGACLTIAQTGQGVLEALTGLSRRVMERLKERLDVQSDQEEKPEQESAPAGMVEVASAGKSLGAATSGESGGALASVLPATACEPPLIKVAFSGQGPSAAGDVVRIPLQISCSGSVQDVVLTLSVSTP